MASKQQNGTGTVDGYQPLIPEEHVEQVLGLREILSGGDAADAGATTVPFLGLTLTVPAQVMTPCDVSPILGGAIFSEVNKGDRVLDMGAGSGSLGLIAAGKASEVLSVDINPHAVEAVRANAAANGVGDRVRARMSDVFSEVDGKFDLIIFNPPFQWFAARDVADSATTDEGYGALTRFFREAGKYLADNGRMMVFFSTMGDVGYLQKLIDDSGFRHDVVFRTTRPVADVPVEFTCHRLS
ncbi:HemK2/MTQ2 family protein methyltransferase [Streptomyces sp. NPDC006617]|uniref:HemK2/MTQ2 family protein methyltransferase n=1 Tax=Streptomyces sp. NPDC006617 TaxID=3155354 RepID=UPI0033B41A75